MKRLTSLLFSLALISLSSCQKVIDLNVNNAAPQLVIEGNITNAAGPYSLHLSKTTNLNAADNNLPVSNAVVVLRDDQGQSDTLSETMPGQYLTHNIQGIPGHTYQLDIIAEGQAYAAVTTMPQPVSLDSLYLLPAQSMGKEILQPVAVFKDPAGVRNYYRLVLYKNGVANKQLFVMDDQFTDGQLMKVPLPDEDLIYSVSDHIQVELQGISEAMYLYYSSLQQTMNQNSAAPANPVRQFSGGSALGYFSAHCVFTGSLTVH